MFIRKVFHDAVVDGVGVCEYRVENPRCMVTNRNIAKIKYKVLLYIQQVNAKIFLYTLLNY